MKSIFKITLLLCSIIAFTHCKKEIKKHKNEKKSNIPIAFLKTQLAENSNEQIKTILKDEIKGINVEHIAITNKKEDTFSEDYKAIFLFIKGNGNVVAADSIYDIIPETILLPQSLKNITINAAKNDTLHYLRITTKLTEQDRLDLANFLDERTKKVYHAKFIDCQSYTEPIKSPNTVSRTILPNKYIPRIAMGTVQTKGPDRVGFHEHPMLEQLFLGLSNNNTIVYADEDQIDFPEFSVLHIPLGSSHSVSVDEGKIMYYVWMDFFRDAKGEEWLKTHNTDE